MYGNRNLRFLVGIGLVLVLVLVVLIVAITHHNQPQISLQPTMASYASNPSAQVAMLIDGPVNAESLHNQVLITINDYQTTIKVFRGYNDHVVSQDTFPMSIAGFHVFLRSLEYAGYNDGSNNPALSQASGYCPTGDRYIFTFNVNGRQVERYWITNCGSTPYTYDGNLGLTIELFQAQVPNYSNIVSNYNI